MRIAGIDYGRARIGIAISDAQQLLAQGIAVVSTTKDPEQTLSAIQQVLAPYLPLQHLVIGLPLALNGKNSPLSEEVQVFAKRLAAKMDLTITLQDERLTSAQAERLLKEAHLSRKQRAQISDSLAASLILQSFLDQQGI